MVIKISVRSGGLYKGSKVVQTPCFIGRSKDVNLTISHPSVSRKHCELYEDEAGQLYLRDNSSLNGTLLRGEFVEGPVPVQVGDEFVIGELQLRIEPPTAIDSETAVQGTEIVERMSDLVTAVQASPVVSNNDGELGLAAE